MASSFGAVFGADDVLGEWWTWPEAAALASYLDRFLAEMQADGVPPPTSILCQDVINFCEDDTERRCPSGKPAVQCVKSRTVYATNVQDPPPSKWKEEADPSSYPGCAVLTHTYENVHALREAGGDGGLTLRTVFINVEKTEVGSTASDARVVTHARLFFSQG